MVASGFFLLRQQKEFINQIDKRVWVGEMYYLEVSLLESAEEIWKAKTPRNI